ncbi:hypothetical protein [Rhizobium arsenicireducens]
MDNQRTKLMTRRDELLAAMNKAGYWDPARYEEMREVEKNIALLPEPVVIPPDEPEPDPPEVLPEPEVKPKKGRY